MDDLITGVTGGYPEETPWPSEAWDSSEPPEGVNLEPLIETLFDEQGPLAVTQSMVIVHRGRIVAERYAGELGSFIAEPVKVTAETPLLSWSMAKTMLVICVGMLVESGQLDLDAPAPVEEWSTPGDPRGAITLRDLLEMRDGLDFHEDYVDDAVSDVITMLFGEGKADMAHFTASRPLAVPPGTRFNYSSGTTNVIARIVGDALGGEHAMREFLAERLFGALSMTSAVPTFDDAGTFVASSFVHATARDFARFGLMLCRGGKANGAQIVPESWIDALRTPRSADAETGWLYSMQAWVVGDEFGTFWCSGYEGQRIMACPPKDLVVVRTGQTPDDRAQDVQDWVLSVVKAFPTLD